MQSIQQGLAADGSGVQYADFYSNFDSTKVGLDTNLTGKSEALSMQQEIKNNVSELFSKYNENHTDTAVAKTKAAPIYWVIGGIGFVVLNVITALIAAKVIK